MDSISCDAASSFRVSEGLSLRNPSQKQGVSKFFGGLYQIAAGGFSRQHRIPEWFQPALQGAI